MSGRTLMIQGTASHVGKSTLVAGFCRLFARRGYRVAPFKAQNMALNSYVTLDGREIGRSQAFQARAAGVEPLAEMNPVLLKPSSETGSQVVLLGEPVKHMGVREYHAYQPIALETVAASLNFLRERFDLVIMEGAGSPAEINLRDRDIANMRAAALGDAPVLLVGDIERGGVFASLYGTMALLTPEERVRVKGIIINKFRGDVSLLDSGLAFLEQECKVPVLGVLPYLRRLIVEEEDSLGLENQLGRSQEQTPYAASTGGQGSPPAEVVVLRLPHISNFTDFDALAAEQGIQVRYVEDLAEWGEPHLVILPGTKSTAADLGWLRERGLAVRIQKFASEGGKVLGICGGYQMLGRAILDPDGVESGQQRIAGLGLLDVETRFQPIKERSRVLGVGCGGWLAGAEMSGYEIHQGVTSRGPGAMPFLRLSQRGGKQEVSEEGGIDPTGRIAGTYLHGFFDTPACRSAFRSLLGLPNAGLPTASSLEVFDRLADWLEQNLAMDQILRIVGLDG
jgi:adenosylcobyric acid synthase